MARTYPLAELNSLIKPAPWSGAYKIPWHEVDFSQRMLNEHLNQNHNAASRKNKIIDKHIRRLSEHFKSTHASKILDLGCGPGLYAAGLQEQGFNCTGIDFSPASISYAKTRSNEKNLNCTFRLADLREGNYGNNFDAAFFIFGEANAFAAKELKIILRHCYNALNAGGTLILEVHTWTFIKNLAEKPNHWQRLNSGLFSDKPHLYLYESAWYEKEATSCDYHYIIFPEEDQFELYVNTLQAYSQMEYKTILEETGFSNIQILKALDGDDISDDGLFEMRAFKA